MRIIQVAKISSNEIKSLEKTRDAIKKISLSLRKSGVSTDLTSIGFDLDEVIYQLTKKD